MRIFRYTFMLCGDKLNSAALVNKLNGAYSICNSETIGSIADAQGAISVEPPIEAVVDNDYDLVNTYYTWFSSFLEVNHGVFAEYGADDLRIFMEIFYVKDHQCNLEVFDRDTLSSIGRYNVALPISIYTLSEEALTKWADEIKQSWRGSRDAASIL